MLDLAKQPRPLVAVRQAGNKIPALAGLCRCGDTAPSRSDDRAKGRCAVLPANAVANFEKS